jgi:SAM-dependent methyltransferase
MKDCRRIERTTSTGYTSSSHTGTSLDLWKGWFMLPLFTITLFVSALLLFFVQPMFARMVLPMLGGSPSVWNTAMVFYQAMLLLGYSYAHLITRWLPVRRQIVVHTLLLLLPLLVLPIGVPEGWVPPANTNPVWWLLLLLMASVGLPFLVVSTTSPLLQKWFAGSGHRAARDPYFLYAASNAGSMLALLAYPLLAEPFLQLAEQSSLWAVGYGVMMLLIVACATSLWRVSGQSNAALIASDTTTVVEPILWKRRLRWILLAAIPSSLMLSVTNYISTDLAPIPLMWVLPLGLYLLTFILVFATRPPIPHSFMKRMLPLTIIPLALTIALEMTDPLWLMMFLHLLTFWVVTMVCHGELAQDRPDARYLTEFYLLLSVGGVLGGIVNALIAPLIFDTLVEYPLMLVLACLAVPVVQQRDHFLRLRHLDWMLPIVVLIVMVAAMVIMEATTGARNIIVVRVIYATAGLVCFSFSRRALRFGLALAAILVVSSFYPLGAHQVIASERSFFGIHRVRTDPENAYHFLVHGNIVHGKQSTDPARAREPLTYYYSTGPAGQVFNSLYGANTPARVAVVGLGTGALACYRQPGQDWTFYEIDPLVEQLARDKRYFNSFEACGADIPVVLGDARLSLLDAPDGSFDVLVLDAYSSDTVPVHLVTREALQLYLRKLSPDGTILFHISNKYLDLQPVIARLTEDAGLVGIYRTDTRLTKEEEEQGKSASEWAIVARNATAFQPLLNDTQWKPMQAPAGTPLWTDNFSSILSVLR